MPVVRISALPQQPAAEITALLQRLCVRLAEIDDVEARHWWATWQPIEPGAYVEGEVAATSTQPRISHPPLVEIQAFTGRDPRRVEQLLEAAAAVLAEGLRMEAGNVFVTWTELQPGRVLTGGEIRR
jgi:phenylpyruvate tautomerase PptA (4-oxalocrotonate tautomerase family)